MEVDLNKYKDKAPELGAKKLFDQLCYSCPIWDSIGSITHFPVFFILNRTQS